MTSSSPSPRATLVGSTLPASTLSLLTTRRDSSSAPFQVCIDAHHALREVRCADAVELFQVVDRNRTYLRQWMPWLDTTRTVEDVRTFLKTALGQAAENRGFQAAVLVEGRIVGVIGHHGIDWPNRSTTIGYWLDQGYQGQGLMTLSGRAIVKHAFRELGLNRVEIRCATENARSRAIAHRLAFRLEGTRREAEWLRDRFVDHAIYGQLEEEWAAG